MTILNATFNVADRALDGYVSESGHTFAKHPNFPTSDMAIVGGEVYHNASLTNNIYYAGVPAVADGVVQATVNAKASINSQSLTLMQRVSLTEDTGYTFGVNGFGAVLANKRVAGVVTAISIKTRSTGYTLQPGTSADFRYVLQGNQHRFYVNNVLVALHEDTSIAAAGVQGLHMARTGASTPTAAITADSMTSDAVPAATPGPVNATFTAADGTLLTDYVSESGHRFFELFHFAASAPTISGGAVNKGIAAAEGYLATTSTLKSGRSS